MKTQLFRLFGKEDIVEITVDQLDGQTIVYWEDIEQVFPGVQHVMHGRVAVSMLRDSSRLRITPLCIQHWTDAVLEVHLSTAATPVLANHSPLVTISAQVGPASSTILGHPAIHTPAYLAATTSTSASASTAVCADPPLTTVRAVVAVSPPADALTSAPLDVPDDCSLTNASMDAAVDTSPTTSKAMENPVDPPTSNQSGPFSSCAVSVVPLADPPSSSGPKGFKSSSSMTFKESVTSLAIATRSSIESSQTEPSQGFESIAIHKLDALHDQGAMPQQIAQEVWSLQKQMNDRMILIQSKTEAILNQQLELIEYPIPRLFIVLPEEPVKYDPANWFRTKFRVHFICECGKHTEASNSKIKHHLHLAKHEGYLVREPTEFFKKYGPFLLVMLELIKFGTVVAGHVVPALATLQAVELVDSAKQSVELITAKIDLSLECIDKQLTKVQTLLPEDSVNSESRTVTTPQDLANYLRNVEGLKGVELRQLGSFLKTSEDENLLGNLYRMTTSEGHVKWVCRDHYRANYREKQVEKLREVVKLARGEFDEQLGKITITLESSLAASEFYNAVNKAKGVLELSLDLMWECDKRDLDVLQDALKKSKVPVLRLGLGQYGTSHGQTSISKFIPTSARCKSLARIMELPSMRIVHIVLPRDFLMLSSFHPQRPSHLQKLSFELVAGTFGGRELELLAEALKTNSTLATLDLNNTSTLDEGAVLIAEALKLNASLTALNLRGNSIGRIGAKALAEALKINSNLANLSLQGNSIGDHGAKALAEALKINSSLTTLDLQKNSIGDHGATELAAALKTNSTLTTLELQHNSIWFKGFLEFSEAIKANSTLVTLDLQKNKIGAARAKALAEALKTKSPMTTLNISHESFQYNGARALAEAIKTDTALTSLTWTSCSNFYYGAESLATALLVNSTLTTLWLPGNNIGDIGTKALAGALQINATLTTLSLCSNAIGEIGTKALAEALEINATLTTLYLNYNSIGELGTKALARTLKINATLTTLNLDNTLIGDSGALAMAESLKINTGLLTLHLQHNNIGDNGTLAMAEALKINGTVSTLDLYGNLIGDNGALAMAEALKINGTLSTLGLRSNSIGDHGTLAMAEALKINTALLILDLECNDIRESGAKALAEALKMNSTLTELALSVNKIDDNALAELQHRLRREEPSII
ncbi:hypothetical protein BGZ72_004377 [Mortierella alpina]|nr:hypothetical protein BGZ72_004377 [Mortierella alpina]